MRNGHFHVVKTTTRMRNAHFHAVKPVAGARNGHFRLAEVIARIRSGHFHSAKPTEGILHAHFRSAKAHRIPYAELAVRRRLLRESYAPAWLVEYRLNVVVPGPLAWGHHTGGRTNPFYPLIHSSNLRSYLATTLNSVRRFSCRPSLVVLGATGWVSP